MTRRGGRGFVPGLVTLTLACTDPLPQRPKESTGFAAAGTSSDPSAPNGVAVALEPRAPLDQAEPVSWLRLTTQGGTAPAPEELSLFVGELSAYHLGRLARRDLPQTLLDRLVPVETFPSLDGGLILAPSVPLEPAEIYSLASPELGLIAALAVRDAGRPRLRREWPPSDLPASARRAIYCAAPGDLLEPVPFDVEGSRGPMRVEPWPEDDPAPRCASLEVEAPLAPGDVVVVPPVLGGLAVPPTPLVHAEVAPDPVTCTAPEEGFGPGCLRVLDDRLAVRGPGPASHWLLAPGSAGGLVLAGETLVIPGLEPAAPFSVRAWITLSDGARVEVERAGTSGPVEPHVVVSEVLANAVGAEPQAEWVELVNDGTTAVDLAGWTLADAAAETPLPAVVLAPGAFALVVTDGYAPDPELDVAPPADATLIRVAALGQSGLGNAGELLRLRSPDGLVRSRFPARAAPDPGVSVARRSPWLADDVAGAFGPHAPPGASPGLPNEVAE